MTLYGTCGQHVRITKRVATNAKQRPTFGRVLSEALRSLRRLLSFRLGRSRYVGAIEEVEEENGEGDVDEERQVEVHHGLLASAKALYGRGGL